jgi:hypothetical protein
MPSRKQQRDSAAKSPASAVGATVAVAAAAVAVAAATRSRTDRGEAGVDSVGRAVREQMPGWRLAKTKPKPHVITHDDEGTGEAQSGATLADLRRKFLGQVDASDSTGESYSEPEAGITVFRIEPVSGGPARVAELRDGKIRVVSG